MAKRFTTILILLCLNSFVFGMEKEKQTAWSCDYSVYNPDRDKGEPYLYEVRIPRKMQDTVGFPTYKTRFYLLGSQHNVPKDLLQRATQYIVDSSDVLVTEIVSKDFGDAGDVPIREYILHGLVLDGAKDWTQELSPEAMDYFRDNIGPKIKKAWGIEPHQMSPVVVNDVVSKWRIGYSYHYGNGMDNAISKMFENQGKPVLALENGKVRFDSDDSLSNFHKMHCAKSLGVHVKDLEASILALIKEKQEGESKSKPQKTVTDFPDYFSGDVNTDYWSGQDRSVQKRNLAWIPVMEEYMKQFHDKTVLFVVGYGHFPGDYGLLKLLKNIGYNTRRVYKQGSDSPRLDTLCNYLMNYTYRNLLLEAAQNVFLNTPHDSRFAEMIKRDYEELCAQIEVFADPQSVESAEIGGERYRHLCVQLDRLEGYRKQSHHTFFQRSDQGEYYPEYLWGHELSLAINMVKKHARLAKERSYGHNLNKFHGFHTLEN